MATGGDNWTVVGEIVDTEASWGIRVPMTYGMESRSGFRAILHPDYSGATAPEFHRLPLNITITFSQADEPVNLKRSESEVMNGPSDDVDPGSDR